MQIGFIGAGKVGCSIGKYLKEHGRPGTLADISKARNLLGLSQIRRHLKIYKK